MGKKSYGQYCGLAKALDHVGDRWTLLIVRELLVGPRRYAHLRDALPGIATNLLAQRLRDLSADGIVAQNKEGYRLTDFGRGLEDAVNGLVRWGGRWMTTRDEREMFRPEWLVVALRALLPSRRAKQIQLRIEGQELFLGRTMIDIGTIADPDAVVEGSADGLLGAITGYIPLSDLRVTGDRAAAARVLTRRVR